MATKWLNASNEVMKLILAATVHWRRTCPIKEKSINAKWSNSTGKPVTISLEVRSTFNFQLKDRSMMIMGQKITRQTTCYIHVLHPPYHSTG